MRADFIVLLKNRRSLLLSILLPYLILVSTNTKKGTAHLGGSLFVIGLSITYGIASTSIMGTPSPSPATGRRAYSNGCASRRHPPGPS